MRISSVTLTKFRRFTSLSVGELSPETRLVVMAGPNGSGKSSFFDGLLLWQRMHHGGWANDPGYYSKEDDPGLSVPNRVRLVFHGKQPVGDAVLQALYFRTAYRHDPDFEVTRLQRQESVVHEKRFQRMIETDGTVSNNYQRLASQAFQDAFDRLPGSMNLDSFREMVIGDLRHSLQRVFPDLELQSLGNPLEKGTFHFKKGTVDRFSYKNLSSGEKAVFDLLLDLVVRRPSLPEAAYCIDEPDAHMNTRVQGSLLRELFNLVPQNGQLWIATHSIGMMRMAKAMWQESPASVAFLDFGGWDFDVPGAMTPTPPTRAFWQSILDVALSDLAELVAPREVIICEGPPNLAGTLTIAFDVKCYEAIFSNEFSEAKFIAGGNSTDVKSDRLGFLGALPEIAKGIRVRRLIDRDHRNKEEIEELERDGVRVLGRRHLESYLYDDEILSALCVARGMPDLIPQVLQAKADAIEASKNRGHDQDDIKRAAPTIFTSVRKLLGPNDLGNDERAFARTRLASLITADTKTYKELRHSLFGP